MQTETIQAIRRIETTEILPTFVHWTDFQNTLLSKYREIDHLKNTDNRRQFYKAVREVAALCVHFLESLPE